MLNSQVDATVAAGFKALGENRLKEALAFFQNVVAQAPDRSDILQGLGLTLKSLGDIEGGITQLSKAVSRYPHDVAARLNLGSMLLDAGRAAEAISSFEDVLRRKPGWPIAVRNLGIALLTLGEAT